MAGSRFHQRLHRLAAAEDEFLTQQFLAPVLRGKKVRVRISEVVCELAVQPKKFAGWGVFQPINHGEANLLRRASAGERKTYLNLLPPVRVMLSHQHRGQWFGIAVHSHHAAFSVSGYVPVRLTEEAQQFDTVITRYDGSQFWFDAVDPRQDLANVRYLRESFEKRITLEKLDRKGITAAQRALYGLKSHHRDEADRAEKAITVSGRLQQTLSDAGAEFLELLERGDSYRVTFSLNGRRHVSAVSPEDLTLQMAGICLNGEDQKFDLNSLVGVLKEADELGAFLAIGQENNGMDEQSYWDIHPPVSEE